MKTWAILCLLFVRPAPPAGPETQWVIRNGRWIATAPAIKDSELGVPVYPGSRVKGGLDLRTWNGKTMSLRSVRTTSDPVPKVVAFYSRLPVPQSISSPATGYLNGKTAKGLSVQIGLIALPGLFMPPRRDWPRC